MSGCVRNTKNSLQMATELGESESESEGESNCEKKVKVKGVLCQEYKKFSPDGDRTG